MDVSSTSIRKKKDVKECDMKTLLKDTKPANSFIGEHHTHLTYFGDDDIIYKNKTLIPYFQISGTKESLDKFTKMSLLISCLGDFPIIKLYWDFSEGDFFWAVPHGASIGSFVLPGNLVYKEFTEQRSQSWSFAPDVIITLGVAYNPSRDDKIDLRAIKHTDDKRTVSMMVYDINEYKFGNPDEVSSKEILIQEEGG